jgi:hypothetical protein
MVMTKTPYGMRCGHCQKIIKEGEEYETATRLGTVHSSCLERIAGDDDYSSDWDGEKIY